MVILTLFIDSEKENKTALTFNKMIKNQTKANKGAPYYNYRPTYG